MCWVHLMSIHSLGPFSESLNMGIRIIWYVEADIFCDMPIEIGGPCVRGRTWLRAEPGTLALFHMGVSKKCSVPFFGSP